MKADKKVFGYPAFDENGEKRLTSYDGPYRDMLMDIRVFRVKRGEKRVFISPDQETALLLLKGGAAFAWEGNLRSVSRKDVFTEGPWCLHVCAGTEISAEILPQYII